MPLLIIFPGSAGREDTNVLEEIGANYRTFGVLLLNDKCGATITAIEERHQNRAIDINFEISQRWIQGRGINPVTWETLVQVLKLNKLNNLAIKIESSLSRGISTLYIFAEYVA